MPANSFNFLVFHIRGISPRKFDNSPLQADCCRTLNRASQFEIHHESWNPSGALLRFCLFWEGILKNVDFYNFYRKMTQNSERVRSPND